MSTFRTKEEAQTTEVQAKPVKPVESDSQPIIKVPDLMYTYEQDQGKPYTAEYFDLGSVWNESPEMERDIKEIEGYVREQVTKGNVDNSVKAADSFIKELERKAGLNRYESTNNRISALLAYIDFKRTVNGR